MLAGIYSSLSDLCCPHGLELQGFIRVLFTSHQLPDGSEIELPEIERILGDVSIEGRLIQQHYYKAIGELVVKWVAAFKVTDVIGMRIGTNLASHGGVCGHFSTFQVRDFSVNRGSHSHFS